MNIYEIKTLTERLEGNTYPGRGIVIGKTADGKKAATAYFIMGRSANSRNRIFTEKDGAIFTEPFDASKVEDPSLIIYAALRNYENKLIVTNGDQTDTIWEGLKAGKSFSEALTTREFEPDGPNFTPRISAMASFADGDFSLDMGILRAGDNQGACCDRVFWEYEKLTPGTGRFLHTYMSDGNPIPSFVGDPETVAVGDGSAQAIADELWAGLNADNKVSLWVMTRDLTTGESDSVIINRNV